VKRTLGEPVRRRVATPTGRRSVGEPARLKR
jgi:hypothetical protein